MEGAALPVCPQSTNQKKLSDVSTEERMMPELS